MFCQNNVLSDIDLKNNKELIHLNASQNTINKIDLSKNTQLESLVLEDTNLKVLLPYGIRRNCVI